MAWPGSSVAGRRHTTFTQFEFVASKKLRGIFFRGSATPEDPSWRMIHVHSQLTMDRRLLERLFGGISQFSVDHSVMIHDNVRKKIL
jgi:hypothetical protein